MRLKPFNAICRGLIHAAALVCAGISVYFFLGSSIEQVMNALAMLGAAIALEVIAAVLGEDRTAHT